MQERLDTGAQLIDHVRASLFVGLPADHLLDGDGEEVSPPRSGSGIVRIPASPSPGLMDLLRYARRIRLHASDHREVVDEVRSRFDPLDGEVDECCFDLSGSLDDIEVARHGRGEHLRYLRRRRRPMVVYRGALTGMMLEPVDRAVARARRIAADRLAGRAG